MEASRILIAEDEANVRMMLRIALASDGYAVEEVANGRETIRALEESRFELLLLDLNMPMLDGMAVLCRVHEMEISRRPRVIVLTAHASIPAAVKAIQLGAMDFVQKPIVPEGLRRVVRIALGQSAVADPVDGIAKVPAYDTTGKYAGVLQSVRQALRDDNYPAADALLLAAGELLGEDPAYYNLLGVLREGYGEQQRARQCYLDAMVGGYPPARHNVARLSEMDRFGHSTLPIAYGDEPESTLALEASRS